MAQFQSILFAWIASSLAGAAVFVALMLLFVPWMLGDRSDMPFRLYTHTFVLSACFCLVFQLIFGGLVCLFLRHTPMFNLPTLLIIYAVPIFALSLLGADTSKDAVMAIPRVASTATLACVGWWLLPTAHSSTQTQASSIGSGWVFVPTALIAFAVGLAAFISYIWFHSRQILDNEFRELQPHWSSEAEEWLRFEERLRAGSRSQGLNAVFNGIRIGMTETNIRAVLGPPDAVIVGDAEYQNLRATHQFGPIGVGSGNHNYLPMLRRNSKGAYFYKVGVTTPVPALINHTALAIFFDANGKVTDHLELAISADSSLADLASDTRSTRLIATGR